jgi:hypothetical protein
MLMEVVARCSQRVSVLILIRARAMLIEVVSRCLQGVSVLISFELEPC